MLRDCKAREDEGILVCMAELSVVGLETPTHIFPGFQFSQFRAGGQIFGYEAWDASASACQIGWHVILVGQPCDYLQ